MEPLQKIKSGWTQWPDPQRARADQVPMKMPTLDGQPLRKKAGIDIAVHSTQLTNELGQHPENGDNHTPGATDIKSRPYKKSFSV
jgi:hypothetical protein